MAFLIYHVNGILHLNMQSKSIRILEEYHKSELFTVAIPIQEIY